MKIILLLLLSTIISQLLQAQNVGINTTTPLGKLHIKGSADTSQLVIDAYSTQSNLRPLIRLRKSDGTDLLWIHSDNNSNSFLGLGAGRVNNATGGAIYNTFIGASAGISNSLGFYNTAIGHSALYNSSTGSGNTSIGMESLYANIGGGYNTAGGYRSLYLNTEGHSNSAYGSFSLYNNTLGTQNTALGYLSLLNNTIASDNTAIGHSALLGNTTASQNTAVGKNALYNQSFSNGNTAWASGNTAVGYEALYANNPTAVTNGLNNTAVGLFALRANTVGYDNTAVGVAALYSNTSGYENTAIGRQALFYNTTGNLNNAFGYKALRFNNGSFNTAFGNNALENNSTGSYNISIGPFTLSTNTTGSYNTAIGTDAQNDGINSSYNTIIGATAHIAANVNNSIVIGYNAYTNTPNLALLGGPTTAFTGGYTNWSNFSDGRFKKDMDENVSGLDFIMRLRPVTYHMDVRGLYNFWGISPYGKEDLSKNTQARVMEDDAITKKEAIRMSGFVAQEVEIAATESHYDFDGVIKPTHDKDHYRIAYGEFVVPLVKAMQEQQVIIEKQNKLIEDLLKRVTALETKQ